MDKKANLSHLATRFIGVPLMMDPLKFEVILDAIGPRLGIDTAAIERLQAEAVTRPSAARYQDDSTGKQQRDYAVYDGVAVIEVQGTLMKRSSWMDALSGCCSYMQIEDQLNQAMSDTGVNSVLLDIDSPGGEVSGCFDLADAIYNMRGRKPIYAVANDLAASAAYAIASSADRIYLNRTAGVGSIGVFAMHAEQAELDKKIGVKYSYIFAGKQKVDGNSHEPLSDRARAEIQTEVTREYGMFTETVARNRGADVKDIVKTDARLFWADAAIPLLADEIGTFDDAMGALLALNKPGSKRTSSKSAATAAERTTTSMIEPTTVASAEDDEMKKAKKADETTDKKDDDADDIEAKKKAAPLAAATPVTPVAVAAAAPTVATVGSRTDDEILAIGNLCKIAGADSTAYLRKKIESGAGQRYMTVAEISTELADTRSAESGRTALMATVDTNQSGSKLTMERLQSEAIAFARSNGRTETGALYREGTRKGTTPEQAIAASLEANPEVYAAYRAKHNAGALIAQLQAAGAKIQFE